MISTALIGRSLAAAVLLVGLLPVAAQAEPASPQAWLLGLYAPYENDATETLPTVETYLSADRMKDLVTGEDKAAADQDGPFLDHDPLCVCQDFQIRDVQVAIAEQKGERAKATVSFRNFDQPVTLDLDLVQEGGMWRINEIRDAAQQYSLTAVLKAQ